MTIIEKIKIRAYFKTKLFIGQILPDDKSTGNIYSIGLRADNYGLGVMHHLILVNRAEKTIHINLRGIENTPHILRICDAVCKITPYVLTTTK